MSLQVINTFGYDIPRVVVDTLFAPPDDTFAVPVELQTIPFFAIKNGDLWRWNTSAFIWQQITSGGAGSTIYSADDILAGNRIVGLNGNTLTFSQSSNAFLKLDPTLNVEVSELDAFNVSGNTANVKSRTTDVGAFVDLIADFNSGSQQAAIFLSAESGASLIAYQATEHRFSQLSIVKFQSLAGNGVGYVSVDNNGDIGFGNTSSLITPYSIVSVVANPYNAAQTTGEHILLVDTNTAGGPVTINLPTAIGNTAKFTIKKIDTGTDIVTVDGNGGQTIDGDLTKEIEFQWTSFTIVSDNVNWVIT